MIAQQLFINNQNIAFLLRIHQSSIFSFDFCKESISEDFICYNSNKWTWAYCWRSYCQEHDSSIGKNVIIYTLFTCECVSENLIMFENVRYVYELEYAFKLLSDII